MTNSAYTVLLDLIWKWTYDLTDPERETWNDKAGQGLTGLTLFIESKLKKLNYKIDLPICTINLTLLAVLKWCYELSTSDHESWNYKANYKTTGFNLYIQTELNKRKES